MRPVTSGEHAAAAAAIEANRLLGALPTAELRALLGVATTIRGERGRTLLPRGRDAAIVLLSGAAIARRPAALGAEPIVAVLGPGDSLGFTACAGELCLGADVLALRRSEGLIIPGSALRRLVATSHAGAAAYLRAVAAEHSACDRRADRASAPTATRRVEACLQDLADRFGVPDRGSVHITVPLTQDELASYAATSRESAAKALHELRVLGIVATGRRDLVIVDPTALRERTAVTASDPTLQALWEASTRS